MNNEFDFTSTTFSTVFASEEKKKENKNGFAIASLVLGIVSLLTCCCCCLDTFGIILTGVCAILAIVFAFLSKKNAGGKMDAMAIAGLILGIVAIVMLLAMLVALVGTYALLDSIPEEEMLAYLEENLKPMLAGDEATYNEFVEAIKAIYAERAK